MSRRLPLTEPEGERLELKSKDVLREPEKVAREAVAMLNSHGGEIWIGIREAGDRREVESIADAEGERRRLQDHLVDVIEPRLTSKEIAVTIEGKDEGGPVLLVAVEPQGGRGPYAFLRPQGARYFLRRFGDRIVPMSREEILAGSRAVEGAESRGAKTLREDFDRLLASRKEGFWLRLEPDRPGDLRLDRLAKSDLLVDPTVSGTPRSSFNFTSAAYHGRARLVDQGKALRSGDEELSLRLLRSGGLEFVASLDSLWAGRVPYVEGERLLSPEALLGYPISVFRLVGSLLADRSLWHEPPSDGLWAMLAVLGLEGWQLLPGSLATWPSRRRQVQVFRSRDFLMDEPLIFSRENVIERPDECSVRIVRRLYEAFEILGDLPSIRSAGLL
jgi:hypothetical protein